MRDALFQSLPRASNCAAGWGAYTWLDGTPFGAFNAWATPALGNVSDSCGVTRLTCTAGNATVGYSNCTDSWVASPNCNTDTLGFVCERASAAVGECRVRTLCTWRLIAPRT